MPLAAFDTGMNSPNAETLDASGNLYVANLNGNNVTEYQPPFSGFSAHSVFSTFGTIAFTKSPGPVAVDSQGNVFIGLTTSGEVVEYTSQGNLSRILSGFGSAVNGLAIDPFDNLYVDDTDGNSVSVFPPGSTTTASMTFTSGIAAPVGLAIWP